MTKQREFPESLSQKDGIALITALVHQFGAVRISTHLISRIAHGDIYLVVAYDRRNGTWELVANLEGQEYQGNATKDKKAEVYGKGRWEVLYSSMGPKPALELFEKDQEPSMNEIRRLSGGQKIGRRRGQS